MTARTGLEPAETVRFLAHLMRSTSSVGFWGAEELRPWLDELVQMPGDWTEVKNAALQLGIRLDRCDGGAGPSSL